MAGEAALILTLSNIDRILNHASFCAMRDIWEPIRNAERLAEWKARCENVNRGEWRKPRQFSSEELAMMAAQQSALANQIAYWGDPFPLQRPFSSLGSGIFGGII